jgi:hypothetical protein
MSLACLFMAMCQTAASRLGPVAPPVGLVLFGVVFFLGLFLPGWRYSRAAKA